MTVSAVIASQRVARMRPDDRLREAIHLAAKRKSGLLRCARNDVQSRHRHSGMVRRTRPGISRFRVRCFASPRNDGVCSNSKHAFTPSQRKAPEPLINLPPKGRGECRMPNAPAASCAMIVVERTRATTSTPESPGIPARNGFTTYFELLCPQNLPECANGRFSPTARRWI